MRASGSASRRRSFPGSSRSDARSNAISRPAHAIVHPEEPELAGVYGVIFWQEEPADPEVALVQRNVTVFADGEVDRSPCGSGTSARLALLHGEGRLARDDELRHLSIIGSAFTGRVVADALVGSVPAVVTEVEGRAFRTGSAACSASIRTTRSRRDSFCDEHLASAVRRG